MLAFRKRIMQETGVHPKSKNAKRDSAVERKRRIRETGDESFYIPPAARMRVLSCRSAPFKPAHPLSARRALLLTSPCVFGHPACKPRLSCVAKRSLRCPVASPLRRLRRRRYNTLDLASKIVCQGRLCPHWIPCHETARFLWILPHRESRSIPIVLRPSLPKGELPLWTPLTKGPRPIKSSSLYSSRSLLN